MDLIVAVPEFIYLLTFYSQGWIQKGFGMVVVKVVGGGGVWGGMGGGAGGGGGNESRVHRF